MVTDPDGELGRFLRSRRARLDPEMMGVATSIDGRRVTGLRRTEVARLAGISVDYYIKLEQGRAKNASAQVLASVARALRLDAVEQAHVQALARPPSIVRGDPGAANAADSKAPRTVRSMIAALDPVPALVHSPVLDVLGSNRMVDVLMPGLVTARNLARWMFTDPRAVTVFPESESMAELMASALHGATAVRHHRDALDQVVTELSTVSEWFARSWAVRGVAAPGGVTIVLHHERVGRMELTYHSFRVPQATSCLVVCSADPGSPSAAKLDLLAKCELGPVRR